MRITRRGLVIGALATGGLAVGIAVRPRRFALPLEPGEGEWAFGPWIKISRTGQVSVAVPQLEMGQGVTTLLPRVAAYELGADWSQMAAEPAPVSQAYANLALAARWSPLWSPFGQGLASGLSDGEGDWWVRRWAEDTRFTATAEGLSLAAYEMPVRIAAAAARTLLLQVAAERWGVDWSECTAEAGEVRHGERRFAFGALAEDAALGDPPLSPRLREAPPAEKPTIDASVAPGMPPPATSSAPAGPVTAFPRLDGPAKVCGATRFAGDVRLPGMVHAAIRHGPIGDAALESFDKALADRRPQLITLVRNPGWLAAVGDTWWAAERALAAIAPRFAVHGRVSSIGIDAALDHALTKGEPQRVHLAGNAAASEGMLTHQIRYEASPALHGGIETASATARLTEDRLELWVASQAPEATRRAAAKALGLALADVVLYPLPAGGSFDARLETPHAVEAALIARGVGRPVQLTWSRWQEQLGVLPRPPMAAVLAARTDDAGRISGWRARIAAPAAARELGARLFEGASPRAAMASQAGLADPMALEGAVPPYGIDNVVVDHLPVATGVPAGRLRGNAHALTAFFTESFVDELARAGRREPLAYRMAMLGNDPRLAECLQRAAALALWGGGGEGVGEGIACHRIGEGRVAVVARARREAGTVRVERLCAVADIGRIVHLDLARQQLEGGLVFGLGLALGCSPTYENGLPLSGRLASLGLPRLADCPQIAVEFVPGDGAPLDAGELGVAAVAPALANALFSATGVRYRRLPLASEDL